MHQISYSHKDMHSERPTTHTDAVFFKGTYVHARTHTQTKHTHTHTCLCKQTHLEVEIGSDSKTLVSKYQLKKLKAEVCSDVREDRGGAEHSQSSNFALHLHLPTCSNYK